MTTKNERRKWITALEMKFSKALKASMQDFSWQEQTDFLEAMIRYVEMIQAGDTGYEKFQKENILKPFRTKLQSAVKEKLFSFFDDRELVLAELDIIPAETFNALPSGEQGLTEEEHGIFLQNMIRYLKSAQYHHFIFGQDESEPQQENSLHGDKNAKGRLKRTTGDHQTKLNQEQTALLIDYLQRGRVILNGEYLNAKQAGIAFYTLTGYSPENLRIKLGEKELSKLRTKENLTELHNAVTQLSILIANEIKGLKKSKEGT